MLVHPELMHVITDLAMRSSQSCFFSEVLRGNVFFSGHLKQVAILATNWRVGNLQIEATHQHRPMLRRVRILPHLLRDHLSQSRLLCKPLPTHPRYRMPSDLNGAEIPINAGFSRWDDIWLGTETQRMLKRKFAFKKFLETFLFSFVPAVVSITRESVLWFLWDARGLQNCAERGIFAFMLFFFGLGRRSESWCFGHRVDFEEQSVMRRRDACQRGL